MASVEIVKEYIRHLCTEVGVNAEKIFNTETGAWYFVQGNSTIEVFLTAQKNPQEEQQIFIRCMSPLCAIPRDIPKQFILYKTALAINSTYLGFKLIADESRGIVCAVSERNIEGMDYGEMISLISDLGFWAGKLDMYLKKEMLAS
jgi:hypothetical protein